MMMNDGEMMTGKAAMDRQGITRNGVME